MGKTSLANILSELLVAGEVGGAPAREYAIRVNCNLGRLAEANITVDRGGFDPPTFRFSGGRSSD